MNRNLKLYVRKDVGHGKLVVLLHGLFGDGTQWEKITDLLVSTNHRVVTVDLLGHGKSPKPKKANFDSDESALALHNALKTIGASQNITLVGYSMGGAVALRYSAKYPLAVKELVLISTPFYLHPDQMLASNYAISLFITKLSSAIYSLVQNLLAPNKYTSQQVARFGKTKTFHNMVGAKDNDLDPRVVRGSIKNLVQNFDFAYNLSKVKAPVTFYCGKKDSFIIQGQLYALKKFNPYIDIQRLDIIKVDHMLVQNLPKEIASFILKNENKILNISNDKGSGKPILLLHGIESSGQYWDNLIPVLSEQNRVITIDLLGYGNSPKPSNISYSIDEHLAYIHATVVQLGLKHFAIMAHSLGSVLALAYAAKYPKNVSNITLLSPVFTNNNLPAKRFLLKRLNIISVISDTGQLHPEVAKAIGDKRLKKLLPTVRTLQNVILKQQPMAWANAANMIPAIFIYGTSDSLVDSHQINRVAHCFNKSGVWPLTNKGHNFALTSPSSILPIINPALTYNKKPKKSLLVPKNILNQIARLAVPGLFLKSVAYTIFGLLLFTKYAPAVITIGLALLVINKSYKLIRDSFSLKNEGLSYIGYLLLGVFVGLTGYGLIKHPKLSLNIALYSITIIIFLAAVVRILVAIAWTKKKYLKRSLLVSGSLMFLVSLAVLAGNIFSVYIIIYSIAVYSITRGFIYGIYTLFILLFAYMRGFNKSHKST